MVTAPIPRDVANPSGLVQAKSPKRLCENSILRDLHHKKQVIQEGSVESKSRRDMASWENLIFRTFSTNYFLISDYPRPPVHLRHFLEPAGGGTSYSPYAHVCLPTLRTSIISSIVSNSRKHPLCF